MKERNKHLAFDVLVVFYFSFLFEIKWKTYGFRLIFFIELEDHYRSWHELYALITEA